MNTKKTSFYLVLGIGISLLFSLFLTEVSPLWHFWMPANCLPDKCFCEAVEQGVFKQFANTWSSYSFVLAAMLMIGIAKSKLQLSNQRLSSIHKLMFIFSTIIVGIGSAFYHASLTFFGQFIDVFGMYLIATFILVYSWERIRKFSRTLTIIFYVLLNTTFALALYLIPETRRFLFAVILLFGVISEIVVQKNSRLMIQRKWFYSGLTVFAVAYIIWILDITKVLCSPDSLLQGHAVWHILGAVAILFLYIYFDSEKIK